MNKEFDLEEFRLKPEDIKALAPKSAAAIRQSSRPKPTKQPKCTDKFAIVPIWWAARAVADGGINPGFLVCVDLLHRAWRAKGKPFAMPNSVGVDPRTKIRTLRALEKAGLIAVEWRERKSPLVAFTEPIATNL
jgi:hypothetical protein